MRTRLPAALPGVALLTLAGLIAVYPAQNPDTMQCMAIMVTPTGLRQACPDQVVHHYGVALAVASCGVAVIVATCVFSLLQRLPRAHR